MSVDCAEPCVVGKFDLARIVIGVLGTAIIGLAIIYQFNLAMILEEFYLYVLLALAAPILFLTKNYKGQAVETVAWYDWIFAVLSFSICGLFALKAKEIYMMGWELEAPKWAFWSALILYIVLLEGTRRAFGWILFTICAVFLFEPLFADQMPGPLQGMSFDLERVVLFHAFGHESLLGSISSVCGRVLIGYLFFAGMLQVSGGGQFFIDLALSLFGKSRGAPAKVAVIGSGTFGMFSGAPIPNILTTGAFTIPAMTRAGYAPYYAAAVEACASTGGSLVPPVMGAAVFIMASLLEMPYWNLCLAAILPAIIYYVLLYVQADAYAGRVGLARLTEDQLPKMKVVLKEGYPYFLCIIVLLWFVAVLQMVGQGPFVGIITLLVIASLKKTTRISVADFWRMLESAFRLIAELFVLIYTLGVLVGSLNLSGTAPVLANNLVQVVGSYWWLMPFVTMAIAYVMSMGLATTAIYILLAVTVAPAMIAAGFSPVSSHLFCFYVGLLSFIIPPVALSAITAGKIAGVNNVFKVGNASMRLGMGLFFAPLFLVFSPSLLLGQGYPVWQSLLTFACILVGLSMVGMASERYCVKYHLSNVAAAILAVCGGVLSLIPIFAF